MYNMYAQIYKDMQMPMNLSSLSSYKEKKLHN